MYLLFAILGWGGVAAYFSHPPLTALAIAFFAVSAVSLFCGGNVSPGIREDRGNRWVLPVFALLGFLNAYLPAWTDRIGFWTLDGDALRWFGVALFVASAALRLWPVVVLGDRFSGSSQSSPATNSSPAEFTPTFAIPAISGCCSIPSAGRSPSAPAWGC